MRFYIGRTKSKSSVSIVVPSIVVIQFVNGAQFLSDNCVIGAAVTVISFFNKI